MSDETPETAGVPQAPVAASPVPDALVDPDAPIAEEPLAPDAVEYPDDAAPEEAAETVVLEPVAAEPVEPAAPAFQTVYVHAPVPPKKRGNRGIGSLVALLSTIAFAAVYSGVAVVILPLFAPQGGGFLFSRFLASPVFYVPVLVFAVAFILLALIANRANWWAYVLGSFVVALLVYFVSIGILLLVTGVIAMTPAAAARAFSDIALSPPIIIATLAAREVSMWFGAIIASRGRRLKLRNAEDREAFDRERAENRPDHDWATVGYASN